MKVVLVFYLKNSIEQFALALKDHQENKNTTNTSVDKNSKEIESPKDVTSLNKKLMIQSYK